MPLMLGEPAPWFKAPTPSNPEFMFDTVAGRFVVMLFLPADDAESAGVALRALAAHQGLLSEERLLAFVVVRNAQTAASARDMPGLRWFLDLDGHVSRLFGALDEGGAETPMWLLLDPTLRLMRRTSLAASEEMMGVLRSLPEPGRHAGVTLNAPVLLAPRIFEPEVCAHLVAMHQAGDARFTGVMRDAGDRTVMVMDDLKKRRDVLVTDPALQGALRERLERRLYPLIDQAFGFKVTRIERYVVSCYDAEDGAVFHAHRDNTTFSTAHRKFACSLNLNGDFVGGDLRFAEFGPATYRPPPGGAVVFSCGLLHEALPVTTGRRYAFLPFFYDEAGAAVLAAYEARVGQRPEPAA